MKTPEKIVEQMMSTPFSITALLASELNDDNREDLRQALIQAIEADRAQRQPEIYIVQNVTRDEVEDARHAQEDVLLVRSDNTLTEAGQLYVADMRRAGSGISSQAGLASIRAGLGTMRDLGIGRRFSDDYEIPDLPVGEHPGSVRLHTDEQAAPGSDDE